MTKADAIAAVADRLRKSTSDEIEYNFSAAHVENGWIVGFGRRHSAEPAADGKPSFVVEHTTGTVLGVAPGDDPLQILREFQDAHEARGGVWGLSLPNVGIPTAKVAMLIRKVIPCSPSEAIRISVHAPDVMCVGRKSTLASLGKCLSMLGLPVESSKSCQATEWWAYLKCWTVASSDPP